MLTPAEEARFRCYPCQCCGMPHYNYYAPGSRCNWCRIGCRPGRGGHPHVLLELDDVT